MTSGSRKREATKKLNRPHRQVARLEQQRAQLQAQADALEAERAQGHRQCAVLDALCESLSFLQLCRGGQQQHQQPHQAQQQQLCDGALRLTNKRLSAGHAAHALEELLEAEGRLLHDLQQLQQPSVPLSALPDGSQEAAPAWATIAPPHDPMRLFRELAARPPLDVSQLTGVQLAQLQRTAVLEAGFVLQLLGMGKTSHEEASNSIQRAADRLLWVLLSCMLGGRRAVVAAMQCVNTATLEVHDMTEPGAPDTAALAAAAAAKLGLTDQQEEDIALGMPVWARLAARVDAECAELQQQVGRCEAGSSSPHLTSSDSSNSGSSSDSSIAAASVHSVSLAQRREQLTREQRLVERLRVVMHKQDVVYAAVAAWYVGQLTWVQLARQNVLAWPWSVSYAMMGMAIRQRWEQRVQQRVQQRAAQQEQAREQQQHALEQAQPEELSEQAV